MTRRFPGVSVCVSILFLSVPSGCTTRNTLEIPEGLTGIFGYGTLISQTSMEQSLGHEYERPSYEAHLNSFERVWRCVREWRSGDNPFYPHLLRGADSVPILGGAELDLSPKKGGRINGILYLLTGEELESIDQREWGYQRVDVTDEIEEFRIRGGRVYVYVGLPSSTPSSAEEEGVCILFKGRFDQVTSACDSRGSAFREEFERTTTPCEYEIVPFEEIVFEEAEVAVRGAVPEAVLHSYVGTYEFAPQDQIEVVLKDGRLFVWQIPLVPDSETEFHLEVADVTVEFKKGEDGAVTGLILHQGGRSLQAEKIR